MTYQRNHALRARLQPVAHLSNPGIQQPREKVLGDRALVKRWQGDQGPSEARKHRLGRLDRPNVRRVRDKFNARRRRKAIELLPRILELLTTLAAHRSIVSQAGDVRQGTSH